MKSTIQLRFMGILICLALSSSACLKTRAQLRDEAGETSEEKEASRAVPAHPFQDVQPQGQYVIDELKEEITRLSGRLEDLERTQKEQILKANAVDKAADKEELKRVEARLLQLEESQANWMEALKKTQESSAAAKDPSEYFKRAKIQFSEQNFESAAETLGLYLKSPKAKAVQDATFMRAECFFKLKQYKKAIVDYSKFPEKFSKSTHLPEALYKIGVSFEALGMKEDARGFYQELVEKFPKSPQAKKIHKKVKV